MHDTDGKSLPMPAHESGWNEARRDAWGGLTMNNAKVACALQYALVASMRAGTNLYRRVLKSHVGTDETNSQDF